MNFGNKEVGRDLYQTSCFQSFHGTF